MNWIQKREHNKRLYEQADSLLWRIRRSPLLFSTDDTHKIHRILRKAKARMLRRMYYPGARQWPEDRTLFLYQ